MTDAAGVPLVVQVVAANQHDGSTLLPLVLDMPAVAGKPGRPKQKPERVVADKGFDDESLRRLLRWLGVEPMLPRRGEQEHGLGVWRWFVERTISWLHQFRRLRPLGATPRNSSGIPELGCHRHLPSNHQQKLVLSPGS